MKILALTDIHGSVSTAQQIVTAESPDVVILGGDLTTMGSVLEVTETVETLREGCPTLFCIAGNMDSPSHDNAFISLGVSLNGRGVCLGNVGFFGASGAPVSPLRTPYEITEEEIATRLLEGWAHVKECKWTVMVPHAPPYGTQLDILRSGRHVGSTAVRDLVNELQPSLLICGHIHEARGQDKMGKTLLVNCGAAAHGYYARIIVGESLEAELFHIAPCSRGMLPAT